MSYLDKNKERRRALLTIIAVCIFVIVNVGWFVIYFGDFNFSSQEKSQSEIKEQNNYDRILKLSDYKINSTKRFVDSLKKNDTIRYFALRKVIEEDSINYYNKNRRDNSRE